MYDKNHDPGSTTVSRMIRAFGIASDTSGCVFSVLSGANILKLILSISVGVYKKYIIMTTIRRMRQYVDLVF